MNEQDWKALARIASMPEGKRLASILNQRREDCRNSLEQCRDPGEVARLQGQASELAQIAEYLDQARDVIDKRFS